MELLCRFSILGLLFLMLGGCQEKNGYTVKLELPLENHKIDFYYRSPWVEQKDTTPFLTTIRGKGYYYSYVHAKSGDVKIGKSKFRIGLLYPALGSQFFYPDPGRFQLSLSLHSQDTVNLSNDLNSIGRLEKNSFFQVDRSFYQILDFSPKDGFINFKRVGYNYKGLVIAKLNTFLPRVEINDLEGNLKSISKYREKDKKLLLFLWSLGPDQGKLMKELNDLYPNISHQINIVAINLLDRKENIETFIEDNQIRVANFRPTPQTCVELGCDASLPYAMLTDEKGFFINRNIRRKELIPFLKEMVNIKLYTSQNKKHPQ